MCESDNATDLEKMSMSAPRTYERDVTFRIVATDVEAAEAEWEHNGPEVTGDIDLLHTGPIVAADRGDGGPMDNERRADIGEQMIRGGAQETRVDRQEDAETAVTDCLAYVAHFCDRLGLEARSVFADGLRSYEGDFEDGPAAEKTMDPEDPLVMDAPAPVVTYNEANQSWDVTGAGPPPGAECPDAVPTYWTREAALAAHPGARLDAASLTEKAALARLTAFAGWAAMPLDEATRLVAPIATGGLEPEDEVAQLRALAETFEADALINESAGNQMRADVSRERARDALAIELSYVITTRPLADGSHALAAPDNHVWDVTANAGLNPADYGKTWWVHENRVEYLNSLD